MSGKYYIYLNLHSKDPKTFSVLHQGSVIDNPRALFVDGTFKVRQGGYNQAVAEDVKNVHAFVVTQHHIPESKNQAVTTFQKYHAGLLHDKEGLLEVSYNHRKGDKFYVKTINGDYPIKSSDYQFKILLCDHKCLIKTQEFIEYLMSYEKLNILQAYNQVYVGFKEVVSLSIKLLVHNIKLYRDQEIPHFQNPSFNHQEGICGNLYYYMLNYFNFENIYSKPVNNYKRNKALIYHFCTNFVNHVAKHYWDNYSGDVAFPIHVDRNLLPFEEYRQHEYHHLWLGSEYADQRFDLLLTIQKQLES